MGGGRSGLYKKTQGAKGIGIPVSGVYGITSSAPKNGIGVAGFSNLSNIGGVCMNTSSSRSKKVIEVVAALIWREDKFLICQRPANKSRALLWEFVGGKVEDGETREQALIRECREELAINVVTKDLFMEVNYEYSDIIVHLFVFSCLILQGEPKLLEHNAIKWITVEEVDNFDFCSADKQIVEKIKTMKLIK